MGKPYQPETNAAAKLESAVSLLNHPATKVFNDSLIGKTFLAELPGGQLYFDSVLELDTDGSVFSTQDPTGSKKDGTGVSATSFKDAAGKNLDADKINYFVLPEGGFEKTHKIRSGDIAVVIRGSRMAFACFGDRGKAFKLGEGSISLHRALGHETVSGGRLINAAKGGEGLPAGVITIVFPGSGNGFGRTNDESAALGKQLFQKLKSEGYKYEMEILSRYASRQIAIPTTRDQLEAKLADWMQEVLDHTPPVPGSDGDGEDLVATAQGIDVLLYAPTPMTLPSKGNVPTTTVYADFIKGTTDAGRWYVKEVRFRLGPSDQAAALKAQEEDRRAAIRQR